MCGVDCVAPTPAEMTTRVSFKDERLHSRHTVTNGIVCRSCSLPSPVFLSSGTAKKRPAVSPPTPKRKRSPHARRRPPFFVAKPRAAEQVGGQQVCLPGPAPKVDLSRYVHVSGFPSAARTDAVLAPIRAVDGCRDSWFHWMNDTSGIADCTSAEGAEALLRAAAAAADAAADASAAASGTPAAGGGGNGEEADPCRLSLGDMKLVQMDDALLNGGVSGAPEAEGQEGGEGTTRGAKRPRRS